MCLVPQPLRMGPLSPGIYTDFYPECYDSVSSLLSLTPGAILFTELAFSKRQRRKLKTATDLPIFWEVQFIVNRYWDQSTEYLKEKRRADHRAFGDAWWTEIPIDFFKKYQDLCKGPSSLLGRKQVNAGLLFRQMVGRGLWRMVGEDSWVSVALSLLAEVNPRTQVLKPQFSNRSPKILHGTVWINIWKVPTDRSRVWKSDSPEISALDKHL